MQVVEWPLTGRADELGRLGAVIRAGRERSVVLAGPAGVGKSRLAAECLAEAQRVGLPTARAAATRSAGQVPFGAFAALLPATEKALGVAADDQAAFLRHC